MNTFFQGPNGEQSSKRLSGFILVLSGVLVGLFAGIYSCFNPLANPELIKYVIGAFFTTGGGLLVSGIVENVKAMGEQEEK